MKKGILAAAMALALCTPMTVFAEGEATPSPTEETPSIVITPKDGFDGYTVGMSGTDFDAKAGTNYGAGYSVVFVGDATLVPANAVLEKPITADFTAAQYGGDVIVHISSKSGVHAGASLTFSSDDLSPVIVLKAVKTDDTTPTTPAKPSTPATGDNSHTGLWIGSLMIAVLCAGAALTMRKRNA